MTVRGEFEGAELGDLRLERRLVAIGEALARDPEESLPKLLKEPSELEAGYRFLNNDRITPSAILEPHVRATRTRCTEAAAVVVAHDTTEFSFGRAEREGLGLVGRGCSTGFYGHFALAVDAGRDRDVLGVVGFLSHTRDGSGPRKTTDPANEGRRWWRGIEHVDAVLDGAARPIHVMDREADSFDLLASMHRARIRFVVRVQNAAQRRLKDTSVRLEETLVDTDVVAEREVPLSPRGKGDVRPPSYRKGFPARTGRLAKLHIRAARVTLPRPVHSRSAATEVYVNVVHVTEADVPEGQPPVAWTLWTSEPIETANDVLAVIDAYRCRWRIEEYFKALKTGCAVETRQLESLDALLRAVALFAPIAWQLLRLRTLARSNPDLPATNVFTPSRIAAIRAALPRGRKPVPDAPSVRDVLYAIAGIGGHIKHNGEPGWQVLARGFQDLLSFEAGFYAARSDQS